MVPVLLFPQRLSRTLLFQLQHIVEAGKGKTKSDRSCISKADFRE
jgi:hypothetical protein